MSQSEQDDAAGSAQPESFRDSVSERRRRTEMRIDALVHNARVRGQRSLRGRIGRVRQLGWLIAQASIAAGVAWLIASAVLGHPRPVFAPIVALVCLGVTYAQRLRRVAEVTVGVAIGILIADVFVTVAGQGTWQIIVITATAMTTALLLGAGQLMVIQAGVQSIFVVALIPGTEQAFTRWIDALVGGATAILAAVIVPSAPLRQPRMQAAEVAQSITEALRGAANASRSGDEELAYTVLAQARESDHLVRELQDAADEGLDVIASSPLMRPQRGQVRRVVDLINPLDRALRGTRALARRVLVATSTDEQIPESYLRLIDDVADGTEILGHVLTDNNALIVARPALINAAKATGDLERSTQLSTEVVLAQIRSVLVDLLQVTGLDVDEALAVMPPVREL